MNLHEFLDCKYGVDGEVVLRRLLDDGADAEARDGANLETPLHVATRRRREAAVAVLLAHGVDGDAEDGFGKTAYVHAVRRGFDEVAALFVEQGLQTDMNHADRFAVAVVNGDLGHAREILERHPGVAHTGNPAEDRLLADVAGRNDGEPVELLIAAGADLTATGLDSGSPLHQAAWFGQPINAQRLIEAGAPLDVFDATHESSPLGWAVHGSRYSGGG